MVFKGESRGCTAVPRSWGKRMNKKFGVTEAPDWWSVELGAWANQQRTYGKAFKKPASQRSEAEKTYAKNTTERRVALLDGIGCLSKVNSISLFLRRFDLRTLGQEVGELLVGRLLVARLPPERRVQECVRLRQCEKRRLDEVAQRPRLAP